MEHIPVIQLLLLHPVFQNKDVKARCETLKYRKHHFNLRSHISPPERRCVVLVAAACWDRFVLSNKKCKLLFKSCLLLLSAIEWHFFVCVHVKVLFSHSSLILDCLFSQ